MRAVTFQGVESVRADRVADPAIADGRDALVAVEIAAICGSDLHVYHGREKGLDAGTVLGHEFVGRVVETGPDVRTLRAGDRVMCPFTTSCGACFYCAAGLTARCVEGRLFGWVERGAGLHGGQAERVRVPLADSTLLRVPDDLPSDTALLLGDVLSTGAFCADMAGAGPAGASAVVGCGPVGLMAVLAASERGVPRGRLFAIDSVPERLALAERFGATPVRLGGERQPVDAVRAATAGRGADAVLEVVGSPAAARLAYDLVRPGGTIATVGVHTDPAFAFTPAEAYDKNLTYRVGRCPARALMPQLVSLARRRAADLAAVFTHRVPLESGADAYRLFASRAGGCVKVALVP